jgi:hypothetical protein
MLVVLDYCARIRVRHVLCHELFESTPVGIGGVAPLQEHDRHALTVSR